MAEDPNGKVVTFYSYKGGTGRTMSLANVAWILASNGKRVLVVDWDLESPGLHRFYSPFMRLDEFQTAGGVLNLISDFQAAVALAHPDPVDVASYARVHRYAFSLRWPHFPAGATLDFLSAGRQNKMYSASLAGINWDDFYVRVGGGQFLDALRDDMRRHYDYTLIDSRTGLSDIADICTIHLPDVLVDCFTLTEQGIDGAAQVARGVGWHESRKVRILPVPMRIDPAEKDRAEAGRNAAKLRFAGLPAGMSSEERDRYWASMQVPYQAYYGYEESLACFGDTPGSTGTLLAAYEALTGHITDGEVTSLPTMDESLRATVKAKFQRPLTSANEPVVLRHVAKDDVWAEWVRSILELAGTQIIDSEAESLSAAERVRQLNIISTGSHGDEAVRLPADGDSRRTLLDVYVHDVPRLPLREQVGFARLAGLGEAAAIERLLALCGASEKLPMVLAARRLRYPGDTLTVFKVQARNVRFTGREADLRSLRARLRESSLVVVGGADPVALQGLGGIGKSHVALEYAYRFAAAYDVVWWIDSEPIAFVDASLADLATALGIPLVSTAIDQAKAVVQALESGATNMRWLLIFDNAGDPQRLKPFLPGGSGHVIVTSRDSAWSDHARTIQIDVFQRGESVKHILDRVPTLTATDASRIAEVLGDLPIAVNAAAAWLSTTSMPVDEYLRAIEEQGPRAITGEASESANAVDAIWDISLRRLAVESPAAFRLLQLCSQLAPEIALEMVYSDEFARVLIPYDSRVSEPLVRGSLVQDLNRLALLRIDQRKDRELGEGERSQGNQIIIHRLLQNAVRSRMASEELAEAKHQVHLMLAQSRPDGEVDDPSNWPGFRALWAHLEISDAVSCETEAVRRLLIDRVRYLYLRGDLARAQDRAEQTEAIWRQRLAALRAESESESPENSEAWNTLRRQFLHLRFNHANVVRDLGRFSESRAMDEEVLAEQRQILGDRHPHTLMTAGGLGGDLRGLGEYSAALQHDQVTSAAWIEWFGEDHPRTLAAVNNLAVSYRLSGDYEAARRYDEAAYAGRRRILGDNHFNTLYSLSCVGRDLREAGEYERSVAIIERVVASHASTSGRKSRNVMNARANLAVSLRSAGRAREAGEHLDEAYEGLNEALGPSHPDTLACRLSRSVNLLALEDPRTDDEMEAVRAAYAKQLGARHPHTLVCVNNLAMAARAKGATRLASKLAADAARDLADVLGRDHPYTLAARTNQALCMAEEAAASAAGDADGSDVAAALEIMTDVVGRLTRVLGEGHPDVLRGKANEALMRLALGEDDQQDVIESLLDRISARIGAAHPATLALGERRFLHRVIDPHPF